MPRKFTKNIYSKEYANAKDYILGAYEELCTFIEENFKEPEEIPENQKDFYSGLQATIRERDYYRRLFAGDGMPAEADTFFIHGELTQANMNDVLDKYLKKNDYNPMQDVKFQKLKTLTQKLSIIKNYGDILVAQESERKCLQEVEADTKATIESYKEKEKLLKENIGDYASFLDAIHSYEAEKNSYESRIQTLEDNKASLERKYAEAGEKLKNIERQKKEMAQIPGLKEELKKYPSRETLHNELKEFKNKEESYIKKHVDIEERITENAKKKIDIQKQLADKPKEYAEFFSFEAEYQEYQNRLRQVMPARGTKADPEIQMQIDQYQIVINSLGAKRQELSDKLDLDEKENYRDMLMEIETIENEHEKLNEQKLHMEEEQKKQDALAQERQTLYYQVVEIDNLYNALVARNSGVTPAELEQDEKKYQDIQKKSSPESYEKAMKKEKDALEAVNKKIDALQGTIEEAAIQFMEVEAKKNRVVDEIEGYHRDLVSHAYRRLDYFANHTSDAQKEGHKNGDEYNALMDKVKALSDKSKQWELNPEDMAKDMADLKQVAKTYLDAKNAQFRPFPSNQRVVRMQLAQDIMNYCDQFDRTNTKGIANYMKSADIKKPGEKLIRGTENFRTNRQKIWNEYQNALESKNPDAISSAKEKVVGAYSKVLEQVILPESRGLEAVAPQLVQEAPKLNNPVMSDPVIASPNLGN